MKNKFNHKYPDCDGEIKATVQIRPYYDGLEILVKLLYCQKCGGFKEVQF